MKFIAIALAALFASSALDARAAAWQPAPGHVQVPIWPATPPDAHPLSGPEFVSTRNNVAGKPWTAAERVWRPTMTVYSPKGRNTGAAVVVFPGGGYWVLAMDLEGTEVCDWLTSRGITCVLLKYRVPGDKHQPQSGPYPTSPMALQDAQRTIGLVRQHAAQWQIDPHRIGVLGFSAGGHLVAAISTHFERRLYPVIDAADKQSCRPDFAVALYPGHLWIDDDKFELNPDVPVGERTPPTFLLQAEDDRVDGINQSLVYYIALKNAGIPVEMHLYPHGGHAFGLRPSAFPITRWPALVDTWLQTIGMTSG